MVDPALRCDWIDDLETRLPCRLPAHFRSLVTRYIFPEFTCGNVLLFGNTPETIGYQAHELRIAIFHDRPLFEILSRHRYVQFGQPATGSYDPVCFAPSLRNRDAAVVRVDHEEILIRQRLHVVETLAPSFRGLLL